MIRAAGLVLAVLLLGGCGVRPTGVVYAGDAPVGTAPASPQAQVFFLAQGVPTPVPRPAKPGDAQTVFDALLAGPTPEERAKGFSTELAGVRRIVVHEVDGRTLLVDIVPPAAKLPALAFAQIYCTGNTLPDQRFMKIAYVRGSGEAYPPAGYGGQPDPQTGCTGGKNPPLSVPGKTGATG
jgi:hypothetical protein